MPEQGTEPSASFQEPGYWRAEMTAALAELRGRVRAIELEHLQLRTKYLQTQVQLLRAERGWDPAWSEFGDPDIQVLNEQMDMLRDRILAHGSPVGTSTDHLGPPQPEA
jgi:hypothetical protein